MSEIKEYSLKGSFFYNTFVPAALFCLSGYFLGLHNGQKVGEDNRIPVKITIEDLLDSEGPTFSLETKDGSEYSIDPQFDFESKDNASSVIPSFEVPSLHDDLRITPRIFSDDPLTFPHSYLSDPLYSPLDEGYKSFSSPLFDDSLDRLLDKVKEIREKEVLENLDNYS